ncbi:MAG TPA: glycosyltransferase [Polyangiaceae bacterium]|nr:glycosyltransferase [Polyangiaceae bacterium]
MQIVGNAAGGARGLATARAAERINLTAEWRRYYLRLVQSTPRFGFARRFLQQDLIAAMQRLIPADARVLEAGVGDGSLLAALPNRDKQGIDILPEALDAARRKHPDLRLELGDAARTQSDERYDAIICDRLSHAVPDIQQLLETLRGQLTPTGRIYLTCFNFLWSVPLQAGARLGFTEASPEQNWLSASDLENLFALADLEPLQFEDRIILPASVPLVATALNRVGARLPGVGLATLYRIYVLRPRSAPRPAPKVSIVIPARNEAGNIERALKDTPALGSSTEILFVEGNSTDNTYERIAELIKKYRGPLELKLFKQPGKGKGDAVRVGFQNATGELLMILDADLTVPPQELPKFYRAMVSGLTDYVHGTRLVYPMEDEAMRFLNKLGNAFFAKLFSFLLGQPLKDTLCGTKVLWKTDYERIVKNRSYFGDFDPFGDFDLIFGARKLNLKIMEIPVRYKNRTYGDTNIQRFRDGALLLRMCLVAARKIKFV